MKKILVIFGGNSYEHYISCLSARTILNNIDSNVGHRNALTYNERRVNRGYGNRCYY